MSPELDPTGEFVTVGDLEIRSPGISGTAHRRRPTAGGGPRSLARARQLPRQLRNALDEAGFREQTSATVSVTSLPSAGHGRRGVRPPRNRRPTLTVDVPPPPRNHGQVVLTTDGDGLVRWHFSTPQRRVAGIRGGVSGKRRYEIEVRDVRRGRQRSLLGGAIGHIIKVVVFPLVEPLVGRVADYFAGKWEKKYRPYRLRTFLPDDYRQSDVPNVTFDQIRAMNGERVLLLLHGTFSQSHTGLGWLEPRTMNALNRAYGGRMLAFDHYTVSETPEENVKELISRLPDDANLDFDIICHSRGGLVSRVLAERLPAVGSRSIGVEKIVFIATPNSGTVLADSKRLGDLVDLHLNLLTLFPPGSAVGTISAILTVVKQLAESAWKGLDGIRAMDPSGRFLKRVNKGGSRSADYFAFAANYEPIDRSLSAQAKDFLADLVFGVHNDLIVPTAGVYQRNGSNRFPIRRKVVFGARSGVNHSTFFNEKRFNRQLLKWL